MSHEPPTIDPLDPNLLTTQQVSDLLVGLGHRAAASTVWNWITVGRAGIKLPALYLANGYRTSREAVSWWLRAVSDELQANGGKPREAARAC